MGVEVIAKIALDRENNHTESKKLPASISPLESVTRIPISILYGITTLNICAIK